MTTPMGLGTLTRARSDSHLLPKNPLPQGEVSQDLFSFLALPNEPKRQLTSVPFALSAQRNSANNGNLAKAIEAFTAPLVNMVRHFAKAHKLRGQLKILQTVRFPDSFLEGGQVDDTRLERFPEMGNWINSMKKARVSQLKSNITLSIWKGINQLFGTASGAMVLTVLTGALTVIPPVSIALAAIGVVLAISVSLQKNWQETSYSISETDMEQLQEIQKLLIEESETAYSERIRYPVDINGKIKYKTLSEMVDLILYPLDPAGDGAQEFARHGISVLEQGNV